MNLIRLILFGQLVALVLTAQKWEEKVIEISEGWNDWDEEKLETEVVRLGIIIDKIYKQFGKGMELINFASKLKNSLYRFPGLPDDVVSLLKNKYEMIRKIGNRLIIQDNPSLFDDL